MCLDKKYLAASTKQQKMYNQQQPCLKSNQPIFQEQPVYQTELLKTTGQTTNMILLHSVPSPTVVVGEKLNGSFFHLPTLLIFLIKKNHISKFLGPYS